MMMYIGDYVKKVKSGLMYVILMALLGCLTVLESSVSLIPLILKS